MSRMHQLSKNLDQTIFIVQAFLGFFFEELPDSLDSSSPSELLLFAFFLFLSFEPFDLVFLPPSESVSQSQALNRSSMMVSVFSEMPSLSHTKKRRIACVTMCEFRAGVTEVESKGPPKFVRGR